MFICTQNTRKPFLLICSLHGRQRKKKTVDMKGAYHYPVGVRVSGPLCRDLHVLLDVNVLPDRHTFYKTEIGVA